MSDKLKRLERAVIDAAMPIVVWNRKGPHGANYGEYKHMANGDTLVDGKRWEKLNRACARLELSRRAAKSAQRGKR